MNKKILNVELYIWVLFLLASALFVLFPQVDIYISNLFYNGEEFPLNGTTVEDLLYHSVRPVILVLAIGSLVIFFYNLVTKNNLLNINAKVMLYLLLVLSIAPGLVVNAMLKENWGRARPSQTIQYGGDKEFTPAFIMSNQGGYSFSSGHTAAAFSLMGFALLAKNRKRFWMILALTYGVLVSMARVGAGGHFFSDVVTSFFIVYIFTHILYKLLIEERS